MLYKLKIRWLITVITGLVISPMEFRFDKSYRHEETRLKALWYRFCCTFAANYIADGGFKQVKHWFKYI